MTVKRETVRLSYSHGATIVDAKRLQHSFCYACGGGWADGDRYAYMADQRGRGFAIHGDTGCEQLLHAKLNQLTAATTRPQLRLVA